MRRLYGNTDDGRYEALIALKEHLLPQEIADYLGVSRSFVDRQLRKVLPIYLLPGSKLYVYKRSDLDKYLESQKLDPDSTPF